MHCSNSASPCFISATIATSTRYPSDDLHVHHKHLLALRISHSSESLGYLLCQTLAEASSTRQTYVLRARLSIVDKSRVSTFWITPLTISWSTLFVLRNKVLHDHANVGGSVTEVSTHLSVLPKEYPMLQTRISLISAHTLFATI